MLFPVKTSKRQEIWLREIPWDDRSHSHNLITNENFFHQIVEKSRYTQIIFPNVESDDETIDSVFMTF